MVSPDCRTGSKEWIHEVAGILETLNQGVLINDDCNKILFANQILLHMLGRPSSEVLGRILTDLYSPEDAAALKQKIDQRRIDGQAQFEFYAPQRCSRASRRKASIGAKPVLKRTTSRREPSGVISGSSRPTTMFSTSWSATFPATESARRSWRIASTRRQWRKSAVARIFQIYFVT